MIEWREGGRAHEAVHPLRAGAEACAGTHQEPALCVSVPMLSVPGATPGLMVPRLLLIVLPAIVPVRPRDSGRHLDGAGIDGRTVAVQAVHVARAR